MMQSQRAGRLGLPAGNGEDSAADILADEGGGVGGEGEPHDKERQAEVDSALKDKASELRILQVEGLAGNVKPGDGGGNQEGQRGPKNRKARAGGVLPFFGPLGHRKNCGDGDGDKKAEDGESRGVVHQRAGKIKPLVIKKNPRAEVQAFAQGRQRGEEDGDIPEEDPEQQGDVAKKFNIGGGEFCHQPVGRQAQDSEQEAEQGGADDAEEAHQDGVLHPDDEHFPV